MSVQRDEEAVAQALDGWDDGGPGIAVAVLRDREPTVIASCGRASIETGERFTASTRLPIASLSKHFVCTSILLLERDDRLRLADDIRTWLPELPAYREPITIRQLMTNTSGLRDVEGLMLAAGMDLEAPFGHEPMLELIWRQRDVVAPPDTEYLYCNTGFRLLAEIVERASGVRWDAALGERVFGPLGMDRSSVATDGRVDGPDLAVAYDLDADGRATVAAGLLPPDAVAQSGESGVISTLEDLVRWIGAAGRHDALGEAVRALPRNVELRGGGTSRYGFGIFDEPWRGHRVQRHSGGMPGLGSELLTLPDDGLTVICLTNQERTSPTRLCARIAARLIDTPEAALPLIRKHARYVDERHGAVIDVRPGDEVDQPPRVAVWGWDVTLEPLPGGGARTYSTWLELGAWPPVGELPWARLGGVALDLVPVDMATDPGADPSLAGSYRCADIDATFTIKRDDGGLAVEVEGPTATARIGTVQAGTPFVSLIVGNGGVVASLRRTSSGLVLDRAEVRGLPLERIGTL